MSETKEKVCDKVKHNPNCDCGVCNFCDGTEDVWGNRKYKDGIRSSCDFHLTFKFLIMLIIRRKFTIDFRVDTQNLVGEVSNGRFDFTVKPLFKRKLPQGEAEIPNDTTTPKY